MSTTNTRPACAPVLLIGFNRPDFMAAQIAALRPARPRRLYIAVDGPREDRPGEAALCEDVRRCVSLVNWPCETKTLFREKNLGRQRKKRLRQAARKEKGCRRRCFQGQAGVTR